MKGKGEKGSRSTLNTSHNDEGTFTFTSLKTIDHTKICPLLTSIVNRDEDKHISVDELESLQPELEMILTSMNKRVKLLQTEVQTLSNGLERGKDKLGSSPSGSLTPLSTGSMSSSVEQPSHHAMSLSHKRSGKGKSTEERPAKRMRTDSGRATYAQPLPPKGKGKNHSDSAEGATTKVPKNMTPGRFWAMVEPYCCEITKDDLKFLEEQIKFCEDIGDVMKVPPLGKNCTEKWNREDSEPLDDKKNKHLNNHLPIKSEGDEEDVSSLYGPLTQRLIQALLEVNGVSDSDNREQDFLISDADAYEAATIPPKSLAKQLHIDNPKELEQKIKKELQQQGIFTLEDSDEDESTGTLEDGAKSSSVTKAGRKNAKSSNDSKPNDEECDEILTELKRKQHELKNLSSQNCRVLRELLKMGREELVKQELRKKLAAADLEVEETYKKLQAYKVKKKTPSKKEREAFLKAIQDKKLISKQLHKFAER